MQGDDYILEEYDVLVSQGNGETTDDRGQDVKKLSCTIEFVSLVDQLIEGFIDSLTDHLAARY